MKRSHFYFMLEGILCGAVQIAVWELALTPWYAAQVWLRIAAPSVGLLLSAVSFFFLMRRYPGMKPKKYVLSVFGFIVMLPAWRVNSAVFSLAIFPHGALTATDVENLTRLMGVYYLVLALTRTAIIVYYYIRKKRRKQAKA